VKVLLILMLLWSGIALAQPPATGNILGRVTAPDGSSIDLANVSIKDLSLRTNTNDQGYFRIENVPTGKQTIIVSCLGFATTTVDVQISAAPIEPIFIVLTESADELPPVVVTATRSERTLTALPVPVTVITKERIASMGSLRLNDVLAEQTGLAIVNDHGTGIQVQGFNPEYTLILIDGEPLIGRTAGTLQLNRIAVGNIKQVEIIKGPSSSLYGSEALAGVINIITERADGVQGNIAARYGTNQTLDLSATTNYQHNKIGLYAFVNRYSTAGYDLAPESIGNTVEPFDNYTFNTRLSYRSSVKTNIELSGRFFTEQQDSKFSVGGTNQFSIVSGEGKVKDWNVNPVLVHSFTRSLKTTFRFYGTGYKTSSMLRYEHDGALYDDTFFDQTFLRPEIQSEYFFNAKNILTLGIGRIWERVEATRYEDKKQFQTNYLYFQYEWNPTEKLNLSAGGRYDSHSVYRSQLSPKLSVKYEALKWLSIQGSAGVGFKAPDFRQLYLNFTNAVAGYSVFGSQELKAGIERLQREGQITDMLMDPTIFGDIRAESSVAYNLALKFNHSKGTSASINFFHNNVEDLIQTQAVARKTNGQSVFSYFNLEEVFTQGIETDVSYTPLKDLCFSIGHQYLIAKDRSVVSQLKNGEVFARDPETQTTYRVSEKDYGGLFNRSRHMANAKIFYDNADKGWNASARVIYRGRYGFADRNGNAILDTDSEYVKGYFTMNLSASKTIRNILKIQVGCDNLFDYTDPQYITGLPGRMLWTSMAVNLTRNAK
jgi:outer membrane receptor for ferrienterochelin and colicins